MIPSVTLLLIVNVSQGADEAIAFGVEGFGTSPLCCESCDDLSWSHDQANALDDVFDGWQASGWWHSSYAYLTSDTDGRDFMDPSVSKDDVSEEDYLDNYGVDHADVGYISTHGGHTCQSGSGVYFSWFWMGDDNPDEECAIHTDMEESTPGSEGDIELGDPDEDGDLKIMLVDACRGGQYCVWNNGGYAPVDGPQFLMWASYHGDSYDSSGQVTALENYAAASRTGGVGDNWLDFRFDERSVFPDQCPTVIVWGSSESSRDEMYHNGGLDDWTATGSHTGTTIYFFCNCNPDNGDPIGC